jgi:hypothetical protein
MPWAYIVWYYAKNINLDPFEEFFLLSSAVLSTTILRNEIIQGFTWELFGLAPNNWGLNELKKKRRKRECISKATATVDAIPYVDLDIFVGKIIPMYDDCSKFNCI